MFGLGKPGPGAEYEAEGETERVYHEIKQTLRVTGVNLNFRTWAGYEKFLPAMWDAFRPNAETRAFESAADRVRAESVRLAASLGRLDNVALVPLGESQAHQIRAALDLYHYINPKLLVLTCAVRLALDGERIGDAGANASAELIEPGAPPRMAAMEMVKEDIEDAQVQSIFEDIKRTLSLSSINSDYRTLALWPHYFAAVWEHLKPIAEGDAYRRASDNLREAARKQARALPLPLPLSRAGVEALGEDVDSVLKTTEEFERLLPSLIINIALCELVWLPAEVLSNSPFPAETRAAHTAQGGAR